VESNTGNNDGGEGVEKGLDAEIEGVEIGEL